VAVTRTGIYLFLFFQGLYALTASGNTFRVPDEFEVYFQAEHFADRGALSVPQTLAMRPPIFFGKFGLDGEPYAPYGPLAALLALPHHLAGRAVAWIAGVPREPLPQGIAWLFLVAAITSLATSTAAALTVAGFYRAARTLGADSARALLLSLLLGGATCLWVYGTTLYSEAFVAAALVWAAAFLLEARQSPERARDRLVQAAFLLTVAGLTKVTALVFMPGFVLAVLVDGGMPPRRRVQAAAVVAAGAAVALTFQLGWNLQRFGDAFDVGYDWSETVPVRPFRAFAVEDLPRGLAVLLLSPGKSLFVWAPALLLAAWRMPRLWQADRALAAGLLTSLAIALAFYGSYLFPEGGYAHGPRHLVPLIPLLLLTAAHPAAAAPRRASLAVCGAAGAAVMLGAVSVSFLEDQALGARTTSLSTGYYELIDPAPGRARNRYALGYLPFARALATPNWAGRNRVGLGPDYLPYQLEMVRRGRGGGVIPSWLPWAVPVPFVLLLLWGVAGLLRSRLPLQA
jgi:hypothetical protein